MTENDEFLREVSFLLPSLKLWGPFLERCLHLQFQFYKLTTAAIRLTRLFIGCQALFKLNT